MQDKVRGVRRSENLASASHTFYVELQDKVKGVRRSEDPAGASHTFHVEDHRSEYRTSRA